MDIEGVITHELPLQEGISKAGNPWKKKEYVLEYQNGSRFPRSIAFTMMNDRVDSLKFEVGKRYVISVDVESHEWTGRWFTNVNCYAMREVQDPAGQMQTPPPAMPPQNFGDPAQAFDAGASSDDDLPF